MTAAKLGEALSVSESTVVRFAAGLGYGGYPQMQEALAAWVKGKLNAVERMDIRYAGSTQSEILTSVLSSDIEKIRRTMEEMLRVQQDSLAKYKNELDELKHAYRKENEEYPDQGSENDLFGGASAQVL